MEILMTDMSSGFAGDRLYADMLAYVRNAEPDQRLASARTLGKQYGVSHATVINVMNQLVTQRLVYKVHGRGCFVADPQSTPGANGKRTIIFCCAWGAVSHAYYFQIWHGVAEAIASAGYRLLVLPLGVGGQNDALKVPEEVKRNRHDLAGIILPWTNGDGVAEIEKICPKLPLVISQSLDKGQEMCSVLRDRYALGRMAARYLIEQGARRIAAVYRGDDYQQGLHDAVAAAEQPVELIEISFTRPHNGESLGDELLRAAPDGVAFSEDRVALATLHHLTASQPDYLERIPVISHANTGDDILPPGVAKLEHDGHERGVITAQTLISLIEGRLSSTVAIRIKPRFVAPNAPASATATVAATVAATEAETA